MVLFKLIYTLIFCTRHTHLHSNMVLFKFNGYPLILRLCGIYIPIWFYSNGVVRDYKRIYIKFTFQYGSIQIISITPSKFDVVIYIPIWFYSNVIFRITLLIIFKIALFVYSQYFRTTSTYFFQVYILILNKLCIVDVPYFRIHYRSTIFYKKLDVLSSCFAQNSLSNHL